MVEHSTRMHVLGSLSSSWSGSVTCSTLPCQLDSTPLSFLKGFPSHAFPSLSLLSAVCSSFHPSSFVSSPYTIPISCVSPWWSASVACLNWQMLTGSRLPERRLQTALSSVWKLITMGDCYFCYLHNCLIAHLLVKLSCSVGWMNVVFKQTERQTWSERWRRIWSNDLKPVGCGLFFL